MTLLAILMIPANSGAVPKDAGWFIPQETGVWVQWSMGMNLNTQNETEAANFSLVTFSGPLGLFVHNDLVVNVTNVTLVAIPIAGFTWSRLPATDARDPSQDDYAFWPEIPAMTAFFEGWDVTTQEGPLNLTFLVFFDEPNGTHRFSTTRIHGTVHGRPSHLLDEPTWEFLMVVSATAAFGRSRRGRRSNRADFADAE